MRLNKIIKINFVFNILLMALLVGCDKKNESFEVYQDFSDAFASDLIRTNDGGFMITGWGRSSNFESSSNGIIIKLDSEGDSQWLKEYGTINSYEKFNFAVNLGNGEYFLGGTKNNNIWLIKINSSGDIILEKTFASSFTFNAEDACYDSDKKSLFIVGDTTRTGVKEAAIFIVDNNGEILKQVVFESDGEENIFSCNLDNFDSTIILTGSKFINSENGKDALVMKIDLNGNLVWEKTYGERGGDVIWDSEIDNEGNYVLSGTSTLSLSGTSALILKISRMGDKIYSEYIENYPNSAAKDILKKSNNSFVIIGRAGEFSGHRNNKLLILNLNKKGKLESHKIVSKKMGLEGKIAIETISGEILVSGSTNQRKIYTFKINN
jgi:hypothetical protein